MKKEVIIISLLLIAALFIVGCSSKNNYQQPPPLPSADNVNASDGSPSILNGQDVNSGLDNNGLDNVKDPTIDSSSLG
jgi:PBP1b-binding outer membrane lipoprotein LpoB